MLRSRWCPTTEDAWRLTSLEHLPSPGPSCHFSDRLKAGLWQFPALQVLRTHTHTHTYTWAPTIQLVHLYRYYLSEYLYSDFTTNKRKKRKYQLKLYVWRHFYECFQVLVSVLNLIRSIFLSLSAIHIKLPALINGDLSFRCLFYAFHLASSHLTKHKWESKL